MLAKWDKLPTGTPGLSAADAGSDPMWIWCDATGYRDVGGPEQARWCVGLLQSGVSGIRYKKGMPTAGLELAMPVRPKRMPDPRAVSAESTDGQLTPSDKSKVLVGVIDHGCPFAHPMLRDATGHTRVLGIWDQDEHQPAFALSKQCLPNRPYGRAITRNGLNALIDQSRRVDGGINEAACYRWAGCRSLRLRESHGAAVLGLLFGRPLLGASLRTKPGKTPRWDAERQTIDQADLVFVDLPAAAVQDSTSAALARYVADGLHYILAHAVRGQRVVVNISNGSSRNGHDGSSLLEQAVLKTVEAAKRGGIKLTVVLPAGNGRQEQRHAVLDGKDDDLLLFVPPGSEMPQFVTLRWPEASAGWSLRVEAPDGRSTQVTRGEAKGLRDAQGFGAGVISPWPATGRLASSLIVVAPTCSGDPEQVRGLSGRWRISLVPPDEDSQPLAEPVQFWVSRNQRNPGAKQRAHQAYFIDKGERLQPARWRRRDRGDDSATRNGPRRAGSLTGLASAALKADPSEIVVVGSLLLRWQPDRAAEFSSLALANGHRHLPDFSLPGDSHIGLPGLSARGRFGGEVLRMRGTSFSAPLLARALVNGWSMAPPKASKGAARPAAGLGRDLLKP